MMEIDLVKRIGAAVIRFWMRRMAPHDKARFVMRIVRKLRGGDSSDNFLRFLLTLEQELYNLTGKVAIEYGNGLHTKHRHINYAQFFIEHISERDRVLDVGCGQGAVAYRIAEKLNVEVVGIDLSAENLRIARERHAHEKITYVMGDATKELPGGRFDVIILSNILEHIEDRSTFLKRLIEMTGARTILLRVPMYERDWRVPLMDELGVDSQLDVTHFTEYHEDELRAELTKAGLKIQELVCRWGEFYVVATVTK